MSVFSLFFTTQLIRQNTSGVVVCLFFIPDHNKSFFLGGWGGGFLVLDHVTRLSAVSDDDGTNSLTCSRRLLGTDGSGTAARRLQGQLLTLLSLYCAANYGLPYPA